MENYTMVRPEHLNPQGYLFGGQLLLWIDEFAWLAANRFYPDCDFVTRAMDDINFRQRIFNGSILRFAVNKKTAGKTSLKLEIQVWARRVYQQEEINVFTTNVTLVRIDKQGNKAPLTKSSA